MAKFKIGDEVCFVGTKGKKKFSMWKKIDQEILVGAQVFRVVDVIVETCYGGTQVHYNLRAMAYGHDDVASCDSLVGVQRDLVRAREIELEPK